MDKTIRHICAMTALPDAPPDRIELIPVGAFQLADKRGWMRLDNAAEVIAASFAASAGSSGVLPIDFDHRSFAPQATSDSRAAGWITAMTVENNRVMASVDWTPEGRKALTDRAYRFVSPVFKSTKAGQVVLIEGAGLVNNPALPQLRQLASRENDTMDPIKEIAGLLGIAETKPDDIVARVKALATADTQLASIVTAAGVSGDDATTQICARLKSAAPDPAQFVPMASFSALQTQLASLQSDVTKGKVADALEKARAEGKLIPAMEGWATQLASKDLSEFEAWAAAAPVMVPMGQRQLAGRVPPTRGNPDQLDDVERQVASSMGVSAEDFLKTRKAQEA